MTCSWIWSRHSQQLYRREILPDPGEREAHSSDRISKGRATGLGQQAAHLKEIRTAAWCGSPKSPRGVTRDGAREADENRFEELESLLRNLKFILQAIRSH